MERKTLQVGAAVIACALLFRLLSGGVMETTVEALSRQEVAETILFLETGRVVRTPPEETAPPATEETEPPTLQQTLPPEEPLVQAVFQESEASLVSVRNNISYPVDTTAALLQPLSWELNSQEPTVLILHTHATESYVNNEGYPESSPYRSLEEAYNVISVGDRLEESLTALGISVLHDRTLHDYPSYDGAYGRSRETVLKYLQEYPSIRLVLDLHRDAIADAEGNQVGHSLSTEKGSAAKLMLVIGTDAGGLTHPNWRENFSLAVKLHTQLEKLQPGICRALDLRSSRFNQDLLPGMVLVEMGAAGNTRQEALLSADLLAQAISHLAHGTGG